MPPRRRKPTVLVLSSGTEPDEARALRTFVSEDWSVEIVAVPAQGEPHAASGALVRESLASYDLVWVQAPQDAPEREIEIQVGAATLLVAAHALEIPVSSTRKLVCQGIEINTDVVDSASTAVDRLLAVSSLCTPSRHLDRFQRYYGLMAAVRDYGPSTPQDALLLLTEEVGELAKAIRKNQHLDRKHPYASRLTVEEELADVQLFLLHLANQLGTSLSGAVKRKERINHRRALTTVPSSAGRPTFLAIEGIIGAGKTTATHLLAERFNVPGVYEHATGHPFIEPFYRDPRRYALELELTFILLRWHAIREVDPSEDVIADFAPFKDLLFSSLLLQDTDLDLVARTYDYLWQDARRPDLAIFLDIEPTEALRRIAARGRPFERGIAISYLDDLRVAYQENMDRLAKKVMVLPVEAGASAEQVAEQVVATAQSLGYAQGS